MLTAYLKRQWKLLLLLAGAVAVFAAVFALYSLPVEAVAYAGLLCLMLGLILFALGYSAFLRRHRELEGLLRKVHESVLPLPPPRGVLEADYQALLRAVCADRVRLAAENRDRLEDMTDYYTLWAHQIKTPIAAARLLLQEDPGAVGTEVEVELLKIEQYVDMVLGYLRLDSESTDYVLRDTDLDGLLRQKNQHLGAIPAVELHHGPGRCFLHCQIIEECIGSPVHDEDRLPAPVDTRLEVVGDVDDSDYFALFQQLFGAGKIRFGRVDAHLRRSIDQSGVLAAQRAVRPIDHRNGCIADQVRFIHVIVKEAVDEDSSDQHQQDGVARGDDPEFPGHDRRDIRQSVFYLNRCFHSDGSKRPV